MTVRRSPSSPSLNENASVWKGGIDLQLPPKVRTIPSSRAPDDIDEPRSDPALLDALATAPFKPAVQLVHHFSLLILFSADVFAIFNIASHQVEEQ